MLRHCFWKTTSGLAYLWEYTRRLAIWGAPIDVEASGDIITEFLCLRHALAPKLSSPVSSCMYCCAHNYFLHVPANVNSTTSCWLCLSLLALGRAHIYHSLVRQTLLPKEGRLTRELYILPLLLWFIPRHWVVACILHAWRYTTDSNYMVSATQLIMKVQLPDAAFTSLSLPSWVGMRD